MSEDWLAAYLAVSYVIDVPMDRALMQLVPGDANANEDFAVSFKADSKEKRAAAVARGLGPVVQWLEEATLA